MVILFSNRKNKTEKELIEILTACGADFISDKRITATGGFFSVVSLYKKCELKIKKGTAVIIDDTERFKKQILPKKIIGICEDINFSALEVFKNNNTNVITYGNNHKNTLTISSYNEKSMVITLQRTIINIYGEKIYPTDYKITLKKNYSKEAVMCAVAILLLNRIEPNSF